MNAVNFQKVNILVVDPHPLFREGLKRLLETEETFQVIGEGETGEELLDLYDQHQPVLVLMESAPRKNQG